MSSKVGKLLFRNKTGQGQAHKPLIKPEALTASERVSKVFEEMEELRNDNILRTLKETRATPRT